MTKTTFKIIQGAIILGSTIQLGHGAEPTKPRDDTWKVSELSTRELAPHIKEAILGHKNKKGEKDGFSIYRVSEKLNDVPQNRIAIKFDNNEFSHSTRHFI